jgi:hypothetical protein
MQRQTSYKKWFWAGGGLLALIVLWLVATYGFMTVQVVGSKGGERLSVELYNQSTKKSVTVQANGGRVRRFTVRGSYEVRVIQANQQAMVVAKSGGFFGNTDVSVRLIPQPSRGYAGYKPGGCMYSHAGITYSADCANSSAVTRHVPASSNQPTYNQKVELGFSRILGISQTASGVVVLTAAISADEEDVQIRGPSVVLLRGDSVVASAEVTDTKKDRQYAIKPFREGFIVYDSSFEWIRYYSSVGAKPQTIDIGKPADKNKKPLVLNTSGSLIVAVYSDKADYQDNTDPEGIGEVHSSVLFYSGNRARELVFDKQFGAVEVCGTNRLCTLEFGTNQLQIYDTRDTPEIIFRVDNVSGVWGDGKALFFSREGVIHGLDVAKQASAAVFAVKDFATCGVTVEGSVLLVCATGPDSKSVVFRVSKTGTSDGIENKLSELSQADFVDDISVYGRYIMILPRLGEQVYPDGFGGLGYNPITKERAKKSINQTIKSLDIDGRAYTITINGL